MSFATIATRDWNWFEPPGRPGAQGQPHDHKDQEKVEEDMQMRHERPATGRTGALGRSVEKPGRGRSAGPSGQHECFEHGPIHTNK
jgi:hypothetical protein